MVKKEDSVVLLKLLKLGEVEGKSFESIVEEEFRSEFELIRYHKACYTLASILELKVLNPSKRLVAFAIIRQAFSYPKFSSNPFMPFLINAACDEEADKCERAFILHLLGCATIKEQSYLQAATSSLTTYVLKKSFQEFMRSCDPSKYDFPTIEGLRKKLKVNDSPERFSSLFDKNSEKRNSRP
ncbi:unnamed protein product [Cuscuta epithymum]|uniref:CCR4-NOT transcription complex subunit 11 n=1 Tax=Cuscuta epithymum TaxID=186058 RepID=A0AAV0CB83_9ASTE|nr:unnamed protein product [Cuscuta epithymum]CAH9142991.1 unnamed protein product [Cuscuta epithymum]